MSSPASNANRQNLEFGPSQNSNLAERHLRRTTRVGAGMQSAVHWSSSSRLIAMPSSLPRSPAPPHRRLPTSRRATFTAPPGTNLATSAAAALHASLSPPAEPSHLPTSRSASPEPDGEARGADSSVSGSPAPQPPGPPDMPAAPDARELRLTCPVLGCAHPAGVNGRGFLGKRGYVRHLDAGISRASSTRGRCSTWQSLGCCSPRPPCTARRRRNGRVWWLRFVLRQRRYPSSPASHHQRRLHLDGDRLRLDLPLLTSTSCCASTYGRCSLCATCRCCASAAGARRTPG